MGVRAGWAILFVGICWGICCCCTAVMEPALMARSLISALSLPAELLNLRQRFEEDKKRIAELRASRKWRPY